MVLMPMLYLPPLSYMALLYAAGDVCIEAEENYIKSTYRNRCEILGSNGPISLSIPLTGGRDHHQLYRDSKIAYVSDWQHRHRMSILSCYGSSPFFEHYMPYLESFYEKPYTDLFEYNDQLLKLLVRLMKLEVKITYTNVYEKNPDNMTDLRNAFKPGKDIEQVVLGQKNIILREVPYIRVFESNGSSLSISSLDLLFNEGPGARIILQQMVVSS